MGQPIRRSEHGLLGQIPRIHLALRLTYRLEQGLLAEGVAKRGALRATNIAGALWDVGSWAILRRTEGSGAGWRLPLDVAEIVFWESRTKPGLINASALAIPLAMEATTRWGLRGLGIAVTDAVAMTVGQQAGGRRPSPSGFPVIAAATLGGLTWQRLRDRRLEREQRTHAAHLDARRQSAFLAGQGSVAMGADTVVDALEAMAPILGVPPTESTLHRLLDSWKASLAEQAARHGAYLGVTLTRWQWRHNLHPDLSTSVEVVLREGDGTTLLTARQAELLADQLDSLPLAGRVPARVDPGHVDRDEPPGRALTLQIGEYRVAVPGDETDGVSSYDPSAAILLAGSALALAPIQAGAENVPAVWLMPFSAGFAAAAVRAHREVRRRGAAASWEIVLSSLALSAMTGIVAIASERNPFLPSGEHNWPIAYATLPSIYLLRLHWQNLSHAQGRLAGAALASLIAVSVPLIPRPVSWTKLVLDLSWLAINWIGVSGLDQSVALEAERFTRQLRADDEEELRRGWQDGRDFVLGLVESAAVDARTQFEARGASLPRTSRQAVRQRLSDIDRRIKALRAD